MEGKSGTLKRNAPPPPSFDFHGATLSDCEAALAISSNAFKSWSQTLPSERRRLLQELAQVPYILGNVHYETSLTAAASLCP